MAKVEIYSRVWCSYCQAAKALLAKKGVEYQDFDIEKEPTRVKEMVARAGGRTSVPQIFINGVHQGGCDDLYALENAHKLDALLAA